MKKIFTLLMAFAMLFVVSGTCLAAETILPDDTIILGTAQDDEGSPEYFEENDAPEIPSAYSSESLRFSWTAKAVYDLLTTKSSKTTKTVTLWNTSDDYRVTGKPSYSPAPSGEAKCRAGLCYYDNNAGIFKTSSHSSSDEFSSKYGGSLFIPRKYLTAEITYYGFCKNLMNEDEEDTTYAMSGDFYVYNVPMY